MGHRWRRLRQWWQTARSSLVVHRRMKWAWVALWIGCEASRSVTSVALVSRLSFAALVLGSWSAEEAAKVAVEEEQVEEVNP